MKKINLTIYYFISLLFMEIIFKLLIFGNIFSISLISMIYYLLFISIILSFITKLFNNKCNRIIYIVIMSLIGLWFSAEYVCKDYFDFYISWSLFGLADQMNDFLGKCVIETLRRIPAIILMNIPLIVGIILRKKINFKRSNKKQNILLLVSLILSYLLFTSTLFVHKSDSYSTYNLYYKYNDVSLNIERLGIINTFTTDTRKTIGGFEEKIVITENNEEKPRKEEEIKYNYNNLNIDFDTLINNETNGTVKGMHEYFKNETGTLENEYTGMFKDKNLILFMGESFNEVAVNETLTPTLYKLVNNGFKFNNFYTPTIYSTIGGEFQELTGLYAQSTSILRTFRDGTVSFPMGIGNVYKNLNYSTFAYHNNSYVFQDRNKYLGSLGFDNFKGCYNGMEKLINCKLWPQSDLDMVNATFNEYSGTDNFMVFYASVSGHSSYSFSSNAMAKKNKDEALAANLGYNEAPYSYIAANMELDKALESLINMLEEKGKLDDTVIALVGDHYPYELTLDQVNEIASYKKDGIVEVNKSNFILWNNLMDTVSVDKVGSQIDVIPTIYNLFDIDYDSRLIIGKDILSTNPGLAIFGNRSWVSDYGTYFSQTSTFVPRDGISIPDNYVNSMNNIVNNKINMSKLIIENNYYSKVIK